MYNVISALLASYIVGTVSDRLGIVGRAKRSQQFVKNEKKK